MRAYDDRIRGIVDDDVHAKSHLKRLYVAPLLADDAAFKLVIFDIYDIDKSLRRKFARKARRSLRQNIICLFSRLFFGFFFIFSHDVSDVGAALLLDLLKHLRARLVLRKARHALQNFKRFS